ncbi:MAG: hypothetical protein ACYTX0_63670, partial [Nostoc sp.]
CRIAYLFATSIEAICQVGRQLLQSSQTMFLLRREQESINSHLAPTKIDVILLLSKKVKVLIYR